jgi:hypothetical protein
VLPRRGQRRRLCAAGHGQLSVADRLAHIPGKGASAIKTKLRWRTGAIRRVEFAVSNRSEPSHSPRFLGGVNADGPCSEGMAPTRAQNPGLSPRELAQAERSPRAAVVASLAETLTRAVALGDGVAARVVHEAIGQLLDLSAAPEGRARSGR